MVLTNHTLMEGLFIQLSDYVYISIFKKKTKKPYDLFCGPGSYFKVE